MRRATELSFGELASTSRGEDICPACADARPTIRARRAIRRMVFTNIFSWRSPKTVGVARLIGDSGSLLAGSLYASEHIRGSLPAGRSRSTPLQRANRKRVDRGFAVSGGHQVGDRIRVVAKHRQLLQTGHIEPFV